MKRDIFNGIEGLEGSIPFGGIVTTGVKNQRAIPVRTKRFFVSSTGFEELAKGGGFRNLRHPLHPGFKEFNELDDEDRRVSVLRGNLVFQERSDCMSVQLAAQQLGSGRGKPSGGGVWETPPRSMPACTGDGKRARRFNGVVKDEPTFIDIDCPNRLCVFRQGPKKICGALARLYFRTRWPDGNPLPSILVRYQTHGWNSAENMLGMFDAVEKIADGLGMPRESWGFAGLPFEMSVGLKKIPDKKYLDSKGVPKTGVSFPVVNFALEDVMSFLHWQASERQFLLAAPRSVALIGDGMDHEEASVDGVAESLDGLTPGDGIPAVVEPESGTAADMSRSETITREEFTAMRKAATEAVTTVTQVFKDQGWKIPEGGIGKWPVADLPKFYEALKGKEA